MGWSLGHGQATRYKRKGHLAQRMNHRDIHPGSLNSEREKRETEREGQRQGKTHRDRGRDIEKPTRQREMATDPEKWRLIGKER